MQKISENNKRITKNTFILYFRMLLTTLVSLYTVRVVLNTLGEVDYGIYTVVGGVVAMLSFLSGSMASASQRFFAFEIGRKDFIRLKHTFNLTLIIYIGIGVIILLLAETIGLWFLNTKMTIPADRMEAANWVYQLSILSFIMTMFTVPYNAAIIAHEDMKVYAYVSMIDTILKLAVVYLLLLFSFDKLKLYAILMLGVTTIVTLILRTYCKKKYSECRFEFFWDKDLFKEIVSYSGWNIFASLVGLMRNYGVNILINLFFNPAINAAQAIAFRINSVILGFTHNFHVAVGPQIIKKYSRKELISLENLIVSSSKFSFFLLLILSLPIILETDFILSFWLNEVPEFSGVFVKIVLVNALLEVMNAPIITAIQATGNIKKYQLVVAIIQLLIIPSTYLLYKVGFEPYYAYVNMIILSLISFIPRLRIFQEVTGLKVSNYIKRVFPKIIVVSIISILILFITHFFIDEGLLRLILIILLDLSIIPIVILFLGLTAIEKGYIFNYIKSKIVFNKHNVSD